MNIENLGYFLDTFISVDPYIINHKIVSYIIVRKIIIGAKIKYNSNLSKAQD